MDALYQNIKRRREELKMSQDELAKILGYKHASSVNKTELGINDIPAKKICEYAAALHTSVRALMGWEEPSEEPSLCNMHNLQGGAEIFMQLAQNITSDEIQTAIGGLNQDGLNKVMERIQELMRLPEYTAKGSR